MQAILTTYKGPTNTTGARIVAKCQAKRIVVPYDHARDLADNHRVAAVKLADVLNWLGRLYSGTLPNGSFAHVFEG